MVNQFDDFDTGGGGSEGPWLQWSARGTLDAEIPPKSFLIRDAAGKTAFAGFTGAGVVLDIANMQTGWCHSDGTPGVAPEWRMNKSVSRFEPAPGDEYKKGFKMRVALGQGKTADWEQAGAAVWGAFCGMVAAFKSQPPGDMLPLVKMTGTKLQQFKRGSTVEPTLEVSKWVPRPDCLKPDAVRVATDPAPHPAAQPAPVSAIIPADSEF